MGAKLGGWGTKRLKAATKIIEVNTKNLAFIPSPKSQ
jgi:hypothetical protein